MLQWMSQIHLIFLRTWRSEEMVDDWGCQSIHYDDNPKRSFGCFADSGKRWPDLLVHAAWELWGADWAEHVNHWRQCGYDLLEPFAQRGIPRSACTLLVLWSSFWEKAVAAVARMWSLCPAYIFTLCWLGPASYRTHLWKSWHLWSCGCTFRPYFHFHF